MANLTATVILSSSVSSELMADCLSNVVVLRTIFQHISNPDLLKLSLVNKLWNYEARCVMKIRGKLIARLKFEDNQPCKEYLDAFAACIVQMNGIPFSGIRIHLGHCKRVCQIPVPDSTCQSILDQLPLKTVSVALAGEYSKNESCPGSVLALAVLTNFCWVLEEVEIAQIGLPKYARRQKKMIRCIQDLSFPSLKILKLAESYENCNPTYMTDLLRALVARSPKLRELHSQGPIDLMLKVLEGRSAVLVLQSGVSTDDIPDNVINKVRLEYLNFSYYWGTTFNMERFNRSAPMLLRKFSETLHSIDVDAFLAVSLMSYGIRLDNVQNLEMSINYDHLERFEPSILRILKDFDFTHMFPNLDKVKIFPHLAALQLSPDHMLVEQASVAFKDPQHDRATMIKELDFAGRISVDNAEFYAEMFPHIKRLRVQEKDGEVSFGSIWKNWVHLEELDALVDVDEHVKGLDSVFCGIFPEEVAELRQKGEEFLKEVNIVPVMPAVTCLRNLRKLDLVLARLSYEPVSFYDSEDFKPPLPSVYSKVTELIAFAKNPKLTVTVSSYVRRVFENYF